MDDAIWVQIFQSLDDTSNNEFYVTLVFTYLLFIEVDLLVEVVSQVTPVEEVHHQEQVLSVLEGAHHVDDEPELYIALRAVDIWK